MLIIFEPPDDGTDLLAFADQVDNMPVVTANVEALADHDIMGEAWTLPPHCLDRRLIALMHQLAKCPLPPSPTFPLEAVPAWLLGRLVSNLQRVPPLPSFRALSVAEPTGQGGRHPRLPLSPASYDSYLPRVA